MEAKNACKETKSLFNDGWHNRASSIQFEKIVTVENAMENLTVLEGVDSWNPPERRKNERKDDVHIIAVTDRGTGQIVDIGREGLSFGCLYPHNFPDTWSMDILDAKGTHIKQLRVRKIWERKIGHPDLSPKFDLEVGVEFTNLTTLHEVALDYLLDNTDFKTDFLGRPQNTNSVGWR
jgi:hypothetical protein